MLNAALKQSLCILVPPQNGHGSSFTSIIFQAPRCFYLRHRLYRGGQFLAIQFTAMIPISPGKTTFPGTGTIRQLFLFTAPRYFISTADFYVMNRAFRSAQCRVNVP
jgi:hypothetical protein